LIKPTEANIIRIGVLISLSLKIVPILPPITAKAEVIIKKYVIKKIDSFNLYLANINIPIIAKQINGYQMII
jgi:hypothetical protein